MQAKIPQNIDIEDQVIGSLSLRQFMFILVGVGVIIVLNIIFTGALRPLFYLLALMVAGIAGTIAFGKYGDQKFEVFLSQALVTISQPRKRVWKKVIEQIEAHEAPLNKVPEKPRQKANLADTRDDLSRLAELVDSGGKLGLLQKDRSFTETPLSQHKEEPSADILAQAESKSPALEKVLDAAKKEAPKREPLISEEAKLSPNKVFNYPKVATEELAAIQNHGKQV